MDSIVLLLHRPLQDLATGLREKINLFIIPLCLLGFNGCASSTAFQNVDQYRHEVAVRISKETGVDTVWSQLEPPIVGDVYKRRKTSQGSYVFEPGSNVFHRQIETISKSDVVSISWNREVSGKKSVVAQLGYLGMGGKFDGNSITTVRFTAEGDSHRRVNFWEGGIGANEEHLPSLSQILNSAGSGPALRAKVLENTAALTNEKGEIDEENAVYWLVTSVVTVKNLSASVTASSGVHAELSAADAVAFANFLKIPNPTSGAVKVTNEKAANDSVVVKDPYPIVAVAHPLLAKKNPDGSIYMYTGSMTLRDTRKSNPLFGFIPF